MYQPHETQHAIARAAQRLMNLRPSENTVNLHARLAAGLHHLAEVKEADEWFYSLPVVSVGDIVRGPEEEGDHQPALAYHPPLNLAELPDANSTRPPSLIDLYGGSTAIYNHAMRRLNAATHMRYQPAT